MGSNILESKIAHRKKSLRFLIPEFNKVMDENSEPTELLFKNTHATVKTWFSDLNEFEEMQPIEEEEDDIWENLDAQLADTVNIIKNFNFWISYGQSKKLTKWKINLYV